MDQTLLIAGLGGLAVFNGVGWLVERRILHDRTHRLESECNYAWAQWGSAAERVRHLRHSCFITNERGHRVRYVNASPEARAKAEGN